MNTRSLRRVLLAGSGSIGRRHVSNIKLLRPDAKFAFLRDNAREDEYSRLVGAQVFGSLRDAIEWEPDIAVIATPSYRHHELIGPILRSNIASFVEKPVVTTIEHLDQLQHLASNAPPTQIGCVLRFLESLRQVYAWLREGAIGKIARASLEVGQWLPDWRPQQDYRMSYSAESSKGGGVVFDLVHEIDLACWLFDANYLLGAWGGLRSSLEIRSEDVALLALRSTDGLPIAVQLDYVSRKPIRRLLAIGDQGNIHWDLISKTCVLHRPGKPDVFGEGFNTTDAYITEIRELIAAVEFGTPTSLPLIETLRSTRLAIEANSKIRTETGF